ncbi:protein-disulfide reductase DsbD domain-containing protein [Ekhidna sp.]|uniref:protein-disulfide reductase DsbD domain-containing protein n=1 Tax=Ekhidna sp. TaxID=2608089 RepID=UPI003B50D885
MQSIFILTLSLYFFIPEKQSLNVNWQNDVAYLSGDTVELQFTAKIEEGWYVYSQYLNDDNGPIPTKLNLESETTFELIGLANEGLTTRIEEIDPFFGMQVVKYSDSLVINQKVLIKTPARMRATIKFMSCSKLTCTPPKVVEFDLDI